MARRPAFPSLAEATPQIAEPQEASPVARTRSPTRGKSRDGKRGVAFWLSPEAFRQLQRIAFEEETTVQALMENATDLLFQSRNLSLIAKAPAQTRRNGGGTGND